MSRNKSRNQAFSSRVAAVAVSAALSPAAPPERMKIALSALLITLALGAAALLSFHAIYEPDLGWHLAQGREVAAGRMVRTNLFSATNPGYPQPFQSWMFEAGAFQLWKLGGAAAIQAGQAAIIAITLVLIYLACRRRSVMAASLAVAAFGVFLIEPRAIPRPHVASFALAAACALIIEITACSRSVKTLFWAVPVIALWSNVHAESFFGAALIGIFAAGEFVRPRSLSRRQATIALAIAAASTAANAANPFGTGIFVYLWEGARAPEIVRIAELRAAYLPTYAPFFAYLAFGAALMLWKRRGLALWEVIVFITFAVLALRHVRFVTLFLCVTAPIVAVRLGEVAGRLGKLASAPVMAVAAFCAGMLLSPVPLNVRIDQLGVGEDYLEPPAMFSRGAISFIQSAGLEGPVFNSNNLGGYLIWNTYPKVRVFQDSRFQSYPPQHFAGIISAYSSQGDWDKLIASVDWAVLTMQRSSPLTGYGRFPSDQWAQVYRDNAVRIVVRRSGRFGHLAPAVAGGQMAR